MELVWPTLSEVNFWNIDTGAQKKALKSGYQGVQHKQGIVCDGVLILTRLDQNTTSIQAYDMDAITFVHVDANAPAKTDVDIAREWVGKGDRDLHLDPLDHSMAYSIPAMDPKISVWDVSEQKLLKEVDLQGLFPSAVKAIGKKTLLIWDHNDRTVLVYDIEASTVKSKIKGMCDIPPSIYYNTWVYVKDKQLVVVMDKAKKFFKVYNETGEFVGDITTNFKGEVQHLLVSENGERIVALQRYEGKGGKQNPALIIDTVNRKILCEINMGESFVMNIATNSFTADGNYYVYPSQDSQQIFVWNVESNKKEKEITYVVNEDLKGTVIALKISSKQKYLATCYQSYLFVGETYETCYILVAYSFDWKNKYEMRMPGMAIQMMTSSDEKRLLASIQADENQLKAFALYDFSEFLSTGKFDVLAQLRIDRETRFCYLAQDGLKLCIGLADYTGITFMKMCGGDEQDKKSDEPVKDLRNLVI